MASRSIGPETIAYREQLLADVLDHAESEGQEAFLADGFTDLLLDDLESDGYWPDYQVGHLARTGAVVNAWGLDQNRRILFLAIADFEQTPNSATIPASEITTLFNRLIGFHERASSGKLEVSDHDPVGDLLDIIQAGEERQYERIALFVLTNRVAPDDPPEPGRSRSLIDFATHRVWDLETIRRSRESAERLDPICVDLSDEVGGGAPCLSSETHNDVTTYLAFLSGRRLASIYLEYGGRLLERNVRAFPLIVEDVLEPGATLTGVHDGVTVSATVTDDYGISVDGVRHIKPGDAASAATGGAFTDGWAFWSADTAYGSGTLEELAVLSDEAMADA